MRVSALEYKNDCWHSILAVDERNNVAYCSNHFFDNYYKVPFQEQKYKIYSRLDDTYDHILQSDTDEHVHIDDECFLMANSFSGVNSGHDLSILLDSVNYIIEHKIKTAVLLSASKWYPNNLILVTSLLKEHEVNLIYMDFTKVYKFQKIHILYKEHMNIMKHQYLIDKIIEQNKSIRFDTDSERLFNKKVLLLKCHRNSQVTRRDTSLTCEKLLRKLEEEDYIYINPENVDINLLIRILQTAEVIISSWGGILYTNMPFFNIKSKILLLPTGNQRPNHHWKYITQRSTIYHVVTPCLDRSKTESRKLYSIIKSL